MQCSLDASFSKNSVYMCIFVILFTVILFINSAYPGTLAFKEKNLAKIGRFLFFTKALSLDGNTACSSCHNPSFGFSGDNTPVTRVDLLASRNHTPTLLGLNSTGPFSSSGGIDKLSDQILRPLESDEMRTKWDFALYQLNNNSKLKSILDVSGMSNISQSSVLLSLEAYVLSLNDFRSRFDRFFAEGDLDALTIQEKAGYRIFVRKAGCSSCHLVNSYTRDFTDRSFHNIGTGSGVLDIGRAAVTKKKDDEYKFKTPSLRGVAMRTAFMHDGSIKSLKDVVLHYSKIKTIDGHQNIDSRLNRLFLTNDEITDLIAFLKTLTPEEPMD